MTNSTAAADAFEYAACGLMSASSDGKILRANAILCQWIATPASELVGLRRVQDLLSVGGRLFYQTHVLPLLEMRRAVSELKLELRIASGARLPILLNAVRRTEFGTEIDEFAIFIVNDRHKYEQELLHARQNAEAAEQALIHLDRRKDEFLATLAHELRNPLAPIQSVVKILRQKTFDDPQVTWSHAVLARQVTQLARLVDDLLDASRIAEGKLEVRIERVYLAEVIGEAVEGSQALITEHNHTLHVSMADELIVLNADFGRLVQIFQNLLNNAAKYTPCGGIIDMTVDRDEDKVSISIADSGIGIAPDQLSSIFETFSQLPAGASRSQGGLGIGLSLVRLLTERLGGTISVSSEGAGKGSKFVVQLPIAEVPAEERQAALTSTKDGASLQKHVLIIDDSNDAAASLAMLLELDGHKVASAHDGTSGFQIFLEDQPDIVLLDIGLPDISGYDLARKIREIDLPARPTLIAVTGYGQTKDIDDAVDAGFDFHLVKPINYDKLLDLLHRA